MTPDLLLDLRRTILRVFRGAEDFSCVSGSCAAGTATTSSDIDLVVVLADSVPVPVALAAREAFTREYVRLHHRHGHEPDLRYPGEVLYRSDLCAALRGRCLTVSGAELDWCDESEPYRFWVSMIATGVPLTGPGVFGPVADDCADLIAARTDVRRTGGPRLEDLKIGRETLGRCPRLARRLDAGRPLRALADQPIGQTTVQPVLEGRWGRWRQVACRADHLCERERGRVTGHRSDGLRPRL